SRSESTQSTRAVPSATARMAPTLPRGTIATSSAPISGTKTISESSGTPVMFIGRSPRRDHEVAAGHHDEADRDAEGVVLHATGRDAPQAAAGVRGERTDAVHGPVDDHPVEPPQGIRDASADPDEQQVVQVVEPPLVQ